jgi:hypothetical protein
LEWLHRAGSKLEFLMRTFYGAPETGTRSPARLLVSDYMRQFQCCVVLSTFPAAMAEMRMWNVEHQEEEAPRDAIV